MRLSAYSTNKIFRNKSGPNDTSNIENGGRMYSNEQPIKAYFCLLDIKKGDHYDFSS